MLDNLHESITNVTKSSTIVACLELCGYETSEDYRSINSKTLNDIEKYISNISITMSKEERYKYMEPAFIDSPNLFTISPVVKSRLLTFLQQIFALGDFYTLVNGTSQSKSQVYHNNVTENITKFSDTSQNNINYNLKSVPHSIIEEKGSDSVLSPKIDNPNSQKTDKDVNMILTNQSIQITNVKGKINESFTQNNDTSSETNKNFEIIPKIENAIDSNITNEIESVNFKNRKSQRIKRFQSYSKNIKQSIIKKHTSIDNIIDNIINSNTKSLSIENHVERNDVISNLSPQKLQSNKSIEINIKEKVNELNPLIQNDDKNSTLTPKIENSMNTDIINECYSGNFKNRKSQRIKRHMSYSKHTKHNSIKKHTVIDSVIQANTKCVPIEENMEQNVINDLSSQKLQNNIFQGISNDDVITDTINTFPRNDEKMYSNLNLKSLTCNKFNSVDEYEIYSESVNEIKNNDKIKSDEDLIKEDKLAYFNIEKAENITLANETIHESIVYKVSRHFKCDKLEVNKDFNFYHYNVNKRWGFYLCKLCKNSACEIKAKVTLSNNVILFSILAHLKKHFPAQTFDSQDKSCLSTSQPQNSKDGIPVLMDQTKIKSESVLIDDNSFLSSDKSLDQNLVKYKIKIDTKKMNITLANYIIHRSIVRQALRWFKKSNLQINDDFNFYHCDDNQKCGIYICKLCSNEKVMVRITGTNKVIYGTIISHLKIHFKSTSEKDKCIDDEVTKNSEMLKESSKKDHLIANNIKCMEDEVTKNSEMLKVSSKKHHLIANNTKCMEDEVTKNSEMLKVYSKKHHLIANNTKCERRVLHILECGSKLYINKSRDNECTIEEVSNEDIERPLSLADKTTHRIIIKQMLKHFKSSKLRITKDFNFYFFDDDKKRAFYLCKQCLKNRKVDCKITPKNRIVFNNILNHLRTHFGYNKRIPSLNKSLVHSAMLPISKEVNLENNEIDEIINKFNENMNKIEDMEIEQL